MTSTLKYMWLTIKHKYYVYKAGRKLNVSLWQLIIHDYSKFLPCEAPHYGRQFFGPADRPLEFTLAWMHHQRHNPHHWEYWIPVTGHNRGGYKNLEPLPMPTKYVREMVADWLGAGRAYEGKYPESFESWTWFHENINKMNLHKDTRYMVMALVKGYFK